MSNHNLSSSLDACTPLYMQPYNRNVPTFSMYPPSLDSRADSIVTGPCKLFLDHAGKEQSGGERSEAMNIQNYNALNSFQDAQNSLTSNSHLVAMSKYHADSAVIGINTPMASLGTHRIEPSVASFGSHRTEPSAAASLSSLGIEPCVASLGSQGIEPPLTSLGSHGTEPSPRPLSAFTYVGRCQEQTVAKTVRNQNMFRNHEQTPMSLQASLASSAKILAFPSNHFRQSLEVYPSLQNNGENRCPKTSGVAPHDFHFPREVQRQTVDVRNLRQSCFARLTQFPHVKDDEILRDANISVTSPMTSASSHYRPKAHADMRRRVRQHRQSPRWPYQTRNTFSPKLSAGGNRGNLQNDLSVASDARQSENKHTSETNLQKVDKYFSGSHVREITGEKLQKLDKHSLASRHYTITEENHVGHKNETETNDEYCEEIAPNRRADADVPAKASKNGPNSKQPSLIIRESALGMNKNGSKSNHPCPEHAAHSSGSKSTHPCPKHPPLGRVEGALGMDGLNERAGTREVNQTPDSIDADVRKSFRCPQCRYLTDRKNNLKRHIVTMHHTSARVLECCGALFTSKASLRDHVSLFHRGGYRCQLCGRNFCRKALLRRHLTVHSGQKDFACHLCGYATSHKSNLERHQRVHARKSAFVASHPSLGSQQPLHPNSQNGNEQRLLSKCQVKPPTEKADCGNQEHRPSKYQLKSNSERENYQQKNGNEEHLLSKYHIKSNAEKASCQQFNGNEKRLPSYHQTKCSKDEKEVDKTNQTEGSRMNYDNDSVPRNSYGHADSRRDDDDNSSVPRSARGHAESMASGTSGTVQIIRVITARTENSSPTEALKQQSTTSSELTDPSNCAKSEKRGKDLASCIANCSPKPERKTSSDQNLTFKPSSRPENENLNGPRSKTDHRFTDCLSKPKTEYEFTEYLTCPTAKDEFNFLSGDFHMEYASQEEDMSMKVRRKPRKFCLPDRLRETHQQTNFTDQKDSHACAKSTHPDTFKSDKFSDETTVGFADYASESKENENPDKIKDKSPETCSAKDQQMKSGSAKNIAVFLSAEKDREKDVQMTTNETENLNKTENHSFHLKDGMNDFQSYSDGMDDLRSYSYETKDFHAHSHVINQCPSLLDNEYNSDLKQSPPRVDKKNSSDLKQTCSDSKQRISAKDLQTRRPLQASKFRICCLPYRCSECGVSLPSQKELQTHVCHGDDIQKGLLHMSVTNAVRKGCILTSVNSDVTLQQL